MLTAQDLFEQGGLRGALELDGDGEGMSMEDGCVDDLERERGPAAVSDGFVVAADACVGGAEVDGRGLAQASEQVVSSLGVVDGARERLEAEQTDGLLVQLVHGGAAELAGWLQNRGGDGADGSGQLQAVHDQAQRDGGGM